MLNVDIVYQRSLLKHLNILLSASVQIIPGTESEILSLLDKTQIFMNDLKFFNDTIEQTICYEKPSEHLYGTLCDLLDEAVKDSSRGSYDDGDTCMTWPAGHKHIDLPFHCIVMHAFSVNVIKGTVIKNLNDYYEEGDEPTDVLLERLPALRKLIDGRLVYDQLFCARLLDLLPTDNLRCRVFGLPRT